MTARIGGPKTGGRIKGRSLDKGERQLVNSQMAGDIMAVYAKLGGVKWLLKFAEDNPAEFLRQGLSRLFPAAPKDDAEFVQNNIQINNLGPVEAARRVAFALAVGVYDDPAKALDPTVYDDPSRAPIDAEPMTPQRACDWHNPVMPPLLQPEPIEDEDHQRWVLELPLTDEQRRDNAVVRQTHGGSLESYTGSPGEQGGYAAPRQTSANRKPSASELCRRLSRRGKELL